MVRTDRFTSEIVQAALAEYFSEGWYDAYFRKTARTYDAKRRLILELCAEKLSEFGTVTSNASGSHITFSLLPGLSDMQAAKLLREREVFVMPLSRYEGIPENPFSGFVMGFGAFSKEEIQSSIDAIASVLQKIRRESAT